MNNNCHFFNLDDLSITSIIRLMKIQSIRLGGGKKKKERQSGTAEKSLTCNDYMLPLGGTKWLHNVVLFFSSIRQL